MSRFLIDVDPELRKSGITPRTESLRRQRDRVWPQVWWLCDRGHLIKHRLQIGPRRLVVLAARFRGTKVSADNNLLVNPGVAAQWHGTKNGDRKPEDFRPKSHARVCGSVTGTRNMSGRRPSVPD